LAKLLKNKFSLGKDVEALFCPPAKRHRILEMWVHSHNTYPFASLSKASAKAPTRLLLPAPPKPVKPIKGAGLVYSYKVGSKIQTCPPRFFQSKKWLWLCQPANHS